MAHRLNLKRAYESAGPDDGRRVLVDRVWPRGVSKAEAHVDLWLKEVAPSTALRKWFGHLPERWPAFRERYLEELKANPAVDDLRKMAGQGPVTLVYGAKDKERNQAVVLAEVLQS
ncbi:MAG TPA: DUF488 domain-containing protein [Caulobacteraceae bacterium]|jgi:uncharacterized protein YeaO (DUF488 family)